MPSHIEVKNYEHFQHYKDRRPPWIKLYNDLLEDYEFGCLPDASKWLAVGLWLLASRTGNRIPNDPKWIARMIHASGEIDLAPLVSAGFVTVVQDASVALAERSVSAIPEGEEETETDPEPPTSPPRGSDVVRLERYLGPHAAAVDRFTRSAPHPVTWAAGVLGLYGPQGTDERVWTGIDPPDRPGLLAKALDRYAAEGKPYNGRYFRRFLEGAIDEHRRTDYRATGTDGHAGGAPGQAGGPPAGGADRGQRFTYE